MIQNKILTIIGKKGYGKTTLTEKLMIELGKATIIADPRFQFKANDRRLLFTSVASFKIWISANYLLFKKFKLEIIINANIDDFEELATLVNKMKSITFVIDEIDMFFTSRTTNKSEMHKLVHYGRHNKIDIITTSRRPADISRALTSQTDIFFFSKVIEPNDKKYIKALLDSEAVETIEKLDKFNFLRVEDEDIRVIQTTLKDMKILE